MSKHIIAMFVCDDCGTSEKTAIDSHLWDAALSEYKKIHEEIEQYTEVFAFDLDGIEDINDFLMYTGPIRKAPMEGIDKKKCSCSVCLNGR